MSQKRKIRESLDDKSEAMLKLMFENDGSANTSEFRQELGFEKYAIHYRYDKLKDLNLITTSKGNAPSNRTPPKVAELTEKATEEIKKGVIGDVFDSSVPEEVTVSEEEFAEFQDSLQKLENRINALKDAIDEIERNGGSSSSSGSSSLEGKDMEVIKARFDEVASELREVKKDSKEAKQKAERTEEQLDNFKEKFNSNFLPFLRATRMALNEELEINVMDYYEEDM
jgi:hypothetical protein